MIYSWYFGSFAIDLIWKSHIMICMEFLYNKLKTNNQYFTDMLHKTTNRKTKNLRSKWKLYTLIEVPFVDK